MHQAHDRIRPTGAVTRRLWAAALCAVVLAALLLCASSAYAATVTSTLTPSTVVFGHAVTVAGTIDPASAGQQVAIAVDGVDVATAATDAAGQFSAGFQPQRGGAVTARLVSDGTLGPEMPLSVKPKVTARVTNTVSFVRARLVVRVAPGTYRGRLILKVYHHSRLYARVTVRCRDARTVVKIPTRGIGRFNVVVATEEANGLAPTSLRLPVRVGWRVLRVGTRGEDVRGMLAQLARLRIRIPGLSSTLSTSAGDSIVAFQKAYRLPRTYVFSGDDWRKLDVAKVISPRARSPKLHIEIDKTRQILMVVKNGAPLGILAVSTGATGNTPEGWHSVLWKAPATSSWFGGGVLYRTMTFHGNFAIHGYVPVPPYPASHGCVREPMWVANWSYINSYVGEAVYVYH